MAPVSASQTAADVNAARQQGQALQNQYNQQAGQTYGQYQNTLGTAQQSQQSLQDYANQMAKTNYGDVYAQDLASAQQQYGFNPQSLALANKNLLNTQTALQYAPQAAQQGGNYYGATAGQTQQAYQNMGQNLNATLANQSNAVNQYQNLLSATQNQANQQAGQQIAGSTATSDALTNAAAQANQVMANAEKTMNDIETLQQSQGKVTADQIAAYQNAYNNYLSAKASQVSAQGQLLSGQAAKQTSDQQITQYQNLQAGMKAIYGNDWQKAIAYLQNGQSVPANLSSAPTPQSSVTIGGGGGGVSGSSVLR